MAVGITSVGSATCPARATATTSRITCSSNARVSGRVHKVPTGARVTAPTPLKAATCTNFSHLATWISGGIAAVTPA